MKTILCLIFAVLILDKVSAQQMQALKSQKPVAGKKFSVKYDASGTPLASANIISGTAIYFQPKRKTVSRQFKMTKRSILWTADLNIPDSTVLVYLIFTGADGLLDNNENKGYLLPVYKKDRQVQFAYSEMAALSGEGPPDQYGLKKNQQEALGFMKKEVAYYPESETLFRSKFYNMLANSPEREDKAELVRKLSAMKSDREEDLMMTQLYLSFFGTKQQADSLDRLLLSKFPKGNYVQQKKIREKEQHQVAVAPKTKTIIDTAEIIKRLRAEMLNEPVTGLVLKDTAGNEVHLGSAELRGKVMVIDFWATWCKPCIKSFPAMQQVMEKYKNNRQVKFFYICTMEQGNAISNVKEFIHKNPFPFQILMDEKTTDMNLYKAFTHYRVDGGIPYKLVIDGKGNIRFRTVGFSGDDEALVAELSTMITLSL